MTVPDVSIVCPSCGALFVVKHEQFAEEPLHVLCLLCRRSMYAGRSSEERARSFSKKALLASAEAVAALATRTARIRLLWDEGYVSEYPDPLDEDTQAVTLNVEARTVTLHPGMGGLHRFLDSGETDDDGYTVYREIPFEPRAEHLPAAPSRPLLSVAETFDYVGTVPATGPDARWHLRSRTLVDETEHHTKGLRLVGLSPHLHLERVGLSRGGGPLSPLCDLIRPAVMASRIVLTAHGRPDATASGAWFHLDQGLVDVLRPGDELNVTRTKRGGLGLSVIRGADLLVAVGAVTAVPLGSDLKVIVRRDRLARNVALGATNAARPWHHPMEFTSAGRVPRKPQGYTIHQWCPARPPPADCDECASILRTGACPNSVAFASAQLLALSDGLHVESW